ncbi:MAG: MerR family transcriptional regulator [Acidimicrobiales bacterium]
MNDRSYLSIGDVLTLLRQEFPDVTISKIRFLESQGLVDPERTPSGYRKFYEPDVIRLRWVLRQQREHFLPLKIIKDRLQDHDDNGTDLEALTGAAEGTGPPLPGFEGAPATAPTSAAPTTAERRTPPGASTPAARPAAARAKAAPASGPAPEPAGRTTARGAANGATSSPARRAVPAPEPPVLAEGDRTAEELAAVAGCAPEAVAALESFGLITSRRIGRVDYFGEDALTITRLATRFAAYGVEARHLRLHKHAAEREAAFIEQVVLPLYRQRNPEARQRATDTVAELSSLGHELRSVLLQAALRAQLGG